ncbi:MAG: tRNA (N(6)-L-threonylcarbamoyladenosine(37)-C(2))-methylthiotransferase MtaB [Syntrophomonadaceae bacterium]|nr:tRNA (N(6)-L-threonylcarbamoyladenosine(37)-C(2))-methylthiotransferase MtaB [Syntrophomonadaceae bacterium]
MEAGRVALHTLGCKVNQVESDALREDFLRRGWRVVDFRDEAEVYIINSCTVTHVSDRKSRAMVRRAARLRPDALVVLTGCMAAVGGGELSEDAGLVVGNRDKPQIAALVEEYLSQAEKKRVCYIAPPTAADKLMPQPRCTRGERSRALVKIQDGCESFCSYCIVPYARGPVRSKMPSEVLREIWQLLGLGYREIVLTGIHTGHYGRDVPGWDLARLLIYLLPQLPSDCRLRLSSIEPTEFHPELIELLAAEPRLCRHFHIPLQSGSDSILESMGRPYRREDYRRLIGELDALLPGAAFTADVMVGYPGESEEDFAATCELLSALPISDLHVFKYSRRAGTPAAAMPYPVDEATKTARSHHLMALGRKNRREFIESQLGRTLTVVMEKELKPGQWLALTDNYIEVTVPVPPGREVLSGSLYSVRLNELEKNHGAVKAVLI